MQFVVTNSQMRSAEQICDREYMSYTSMMEYAGIACAEEIMKLAPKGSYIAILCGSGNNGGDGFVISDVLASHGISSAVILVDGEPKTDCARYHFDRLQGEKILDWKLHNEACCDQIVRSDMVVDCIFGTGFRGKLPDNAAAAIRYANNSPIRVAVDVPSGINSDTGEMDENYFHATTTLSIAAIKKGLLSFPCCDHIGEGKLLDIGIDEYCYGDDYIAAITDDSFRRPFMDRKKSSHKGSYGRLLNIAGSLRYNGAAAMSTKAALRTGVGLCILATPKSVVQTIGASIHETTYLPLCETDDGFVADNAVDMILSNIKEVSAISVGSGMGRSENTRNITEAVIKNAACPIIIDADGLNSISGNINVLRENRKGVVITPHPAEFSRLTGMSVDEIQYDRISAAKNFAIDYNVTVVLKGVNTVIAAPTGECFINTTGNAGLAKGGSGDVLTGIIASLIAQGTEIFYAAVLGVYLHGLAADRLAAGRNLFGIMPRDIADEVTRIGLRNTSVE